jgi:serine/threonine protein kinase
MSDHRNIVRLLALSWDEIDMRSNNTEFFAPVLITELAHEVYPTLQAYYQNPSTAKTASMGREFLADIADGVAVLHDCGVLHGDLKPDNILLFKDEQSKFGLVAKVADFGFADVNGTRRGRTRRWAAPECLDGCPADIVGTAKAMTSAADIYSFGLLVLFVALGGREPRDSLKLRDEDFDTLRFSSNSTDAFRNLLPTLAVAEDSDDDENSKGPSSESIHSLMEATLQSDPSRRTPSLKHVRMLITGE